MSRDLYGFPERPIKGWSRLSRWLGYIAILLLIALTLLTSVDVVARYWFNSPIKGAFEVTQLLLAALIFVAFPLTTAMREHIEVDLIANFMGGMIDRVFTFLAGLISSAVLVAIAWRLLHHASKLAADGAVTDSLQLPLQPIGYIGAASCLLSAGLAFAITLNGWKEGGKDD